MKYNSARSLLLLTAAFAVVVVPLQAHASHCSNMGQVGAGLIPTPEPSLRRAVHCRQRRSGTSIRMRRATSPAVRLAAWQEALGQKTSPET